MINIRVYSYNNNINQKFKYVMSADEHNLNERLTLLENEIKNLKNNAQKDDKEKEKKEKKEKKDKIPRAPTEYNKFISSYINGQKEKLGNEFKHKVAFGEAAKLWNAKKNDKIVN